jgi:hypothetical protein
MVKSRTGRIVVAAMIALVTWLVRPDYVRSDAPVE